MPYTLLDAQLLCATTADNGLNAADPRLVDRINEAQRRLLRHANFVVRREEYDTAQLVFSPVASPSDPLPVDDVDATKLMTLALWREENNALEQAAQLEQKAMMLLEQSIITAQEATQKAAWQAVLSAGGSASAFSYYKARLGLESPELSLKYSDTRISRLVNEAQRRLINHFNSFTRREEYFDIANDPLSYTEIEGTTEVILNDFDATRLMAMGLLREASGTSATPTAQAPSQPDPNVVSVTNNFQQQALSLLEQNIVSKYEAVQRALWIGNLSLATNALGHYKGRLVLECPELSIKFPDARIERLVNEIQRRLVRHYNYLIRREEYDASPITWTPVTGDSTAVLLDDFDATRLMALVLLRESATVAAGQTDSNTSAVTSALEQKALSLLEQNTITKQEAAQKAAWQSAVSSAAANTFAHYKARIGLESPELSLKFTDTRIGRVVNEAQRRLVRHYNFIVRREEDDAAPITWAARVSGTDIMQVPDFDATRLLVNGLLREASTNASGAPDPASASVTTAAEQQAFSLLEQNIITTQEAAQKLTWQTALLTAGTDTFAYYKALFGLESPELALKYTDTRIGRLINEAQRRLIRHYNFVVRREEYDADQIVWAPLTVGTGHVLVDDFDATHVMAIGLLRDASTDAGGRQEQPPDQNPGAPVAVVQSYEQQALALLEQNIITAQESAQKLYWQTALTSQTPGTFGHTKARLGLDLVEFAFSDNRIGRILNNVEETLMLKGRPVGALLDYTVSVPDGTSMVILPVNVESVLFATLGEIAAPVYSQAYDYLENGPGYQLDISSGWTNVFVDRGFDPTTGGRQYFVRTNQSAYLARFLCKLKFIPHTSDSDKLTVANFPALKEMALSLSFLPTDPQRAEIHEQKALRLIDEELEQYRGGARAQLGFQVRGAGRRAPGIR